MNTEPKVSSRVHGFRVRRFAAPRNDTRRVCGYAASSPCSRSAMMSSLSSMPIESRTTSGPAPA